MKSDNSADPERGKLKEYYEKEKEKTLTVQRWRRPVNPICWLQLI